MLMFMNQLHVFVIMAMLVSNGRIVRVFEFIIVRRTKTVSFQDIKHPEGTLFYWLKHKPLFGSFVEFIITATNPRGSEIESGGLYIYTRRYNAIVFEYQINQDLCKKYSDILLLLSDYAETTNNYTASPLKSLVDYDGFLLLGGAEKPPEYTRISRFLCAAQQQKGR